MLGNDETTGWRLRLLRRTLGYEHAKDFAQFLNISDSRWNNLENDYPVRMDVALLLCHRVSGLSLDWIYFGRTDGLSVGLDRRLSKFKNTDAY